jgi:4-oxalocrotonate tautomerase family enzyme
MAQIKVFGVKENINPIKKQLSEIIHSCVMDAFDYPSEKRFHRFFSMDQEDFLFANERTVAYTIIEISIFEGRSIESKKKLINLLFDQIKNELNISSDDIEITIFETPKHNWGIRGVPGDELTLNYKVNV